MASPRRPTSDPRAFVEVGGKNSHFPWVHLFDWLHWRWCQGIGLGQTCIQSTPAGFIDWVGFIFGFLANPSAMQLPTGCVPLEWNENVHVEEDVLQRLCYQTLKSFKGGHQHLDSPLERN